MGYEYNKSGQCMHVKNGVRCERDIYNGGRGLCQSHLVIVSYSVKKGYTTWAQLEEEGKCRRPLTQDEKNINQMHPHKSYRRKEE